LAFSPYVLFPIRVCYAIVLTVSSWSYLSRLRSSGAFRGFLFPREFFGVYCLDEIESRLGRQLCDFCPLLFFYYLPRSEGTLRCFKLLNDKS